LSVTIIKKDFKETNSINGFPISEAFLEIKRALVYRYFYSPTRNSTKKNDYAPLAEDRKDGLDKRKEGEYF
jgi:hypothetical protein